jgi:protein-L-isoaspartate O-methyltransferase
VLLKVSRDLSRLTVLADLKLEQTGILGFAEAQAQPVEVISFSDPLLLTDNHEVGQLAPQIRDAVFALYQSYPRSVEYDGVAVAWSPFDFPRVWCPSIDTVFLARALKRLLSEEQVRRFAEIGTGSGFLTKFALVHGRLEHAVATDINLDAVRCAHAALQELDVKHKASLLNVDSDSERLGLVGQYDLIVTNPPYVPRPGERHDNPYEGLDLIAKLAQEADTLLAPSGRILLNVSSVAGDGFKRWFRERGFALATKETLRVPLKVNAISSQISPESKRWIDYLLERGLLELDEGGGEHSGYSFWHTLRVFEISRT